MAFLLLVRHTRTHWNIEGRWHGLTDIPLSQQGRLEARQTARALQGLKIDSVYVSNLQRTQQTYDEICNELGLACPVFPHPALNERDYGIYAGKNKWEVQKEVGEEVFKKLRRGWDFPVPKGESIKDVFERVVPFYEESILSDLKSGKNVLVVSSGNTLRALIKYLDQMSDEEIQEFELGFGDVYKYEVDETGKILGKEVLVTNPKDQK